MINRKEHLTIEGLRKIVNLKASINSGLSDGLKKAFPDTVPVQRPLVKDQIIKDPHWLAGFASGEGSFYIKIFKSKAKLGESVILTFQITQHIRDEELLRSLVKYLDCGKVYIRPGQAVDFKITQFEELTDKVIPFFQKYPIVGVKALDFADFLVATELIKNKAHLTFEGLEKIRLIKFAMNTKREN